MQNAYDADFTVYFEHGGSMRETSENLFKMVRDAASWWHLIQHLAGGPPALMKITLMTGQVTNIKVIQTSLASASATFDSV